MQSEANLSRPETGEPFSKFRVFRFLLLWLVCILAVCGAFYMLSQARAGSSITAPQRSGSPHK